MYKLNLELLRSLLLLTCPARKAEPWSLSVPYALFPWRQRGERSLCRGCPAILVQPHRYKKQRSSSTSMIYFRYVQTPCRLPPSKAHCNPQPGTLSSTLWFLGSSLLHTAVVINDREYAYGGHDRHGVSGVYWTKPRLEPPGGTFRCEILQGFTFRSPAEIENIIKEVSHRYQGTTYNLLSNNCNHFTSYLCERLTSKAAPSWINRASSIGIILPCVVPREWIAPPDHDTAEGALLDEEDEDDERVAMLQQSRRRTHSFHGDMLPKDIDEQWSSSKGRTRNDTRKGERVLRDTDGRGLPVTEQAPLASLRR